MTEPQVAPYGSWKSPITSDLIVSETIGIGDLCIDGEDIYWVEMRPAEGGRSVLVQRSPDGSTIDLTLPAFNCRTRVHEYGGIAYTVFGGSVYFSNFKDQRLYVQHPGSEPRPMTPEANLRYADGIIDHKRRRLVCVCEDHTRDGQEPQNTLVRLDLDQSSGAEVLVSGSDFYASPRLSPGGDHLAWLAWDHPNMPWDGTELWLARIQADGSLDGATQLAGGPDESIFQPQWSPDGTLYFISDRTGWWNLYRFRNGQVEPVLEMRAEFGLPQWLFGMSTYAFESASHIVCTYAGQGEGALAILDADTGALEVVETPYTTFGCVRAAPGRIVFLGGSPSEPTAVLLMHLDTRKVEVLRSSSQVSIDPGYLSQPQAIEFPTEKGLKANGFFYPPENADYVAPAGQRPPLLVMSHGGPTAATSSAFNAMIQFWTSRGIAVLDVNYGGSTGYGRAYRERLNGQWGIVDVDDCVNGTRHLVERGEVDGDRLAIRGGSAGGYTTLCALTFRDLFKAGASYYGVSDLEALARETHKFESRYLDRLIAPYPERADVYQERSPIHFIDRLSCPIIFLQGLEDKIVPPNQAEMMVEALRKKGVPVAYVPFEGEQHGFRSADSIKRALDGELYFYARVFGFELADPVEPVSIDNL